jgi:hypothetical protein
MNILKQLNLAWPNSPLGIQIDAELFPMRRRDAAAGIARTTDRLNRFGLIAVSVCGCRLGF